MKKKPKALPPGPAVVLGTTIRPTQRQLMLTGSDLAAHKHVMGVSGAGKSKFLASLFVQLLNQGIPCAVIDPHADLARDILALLIETSFYNDQRAFERLWYVDFSQVNEHQAIPFNVLNQPYPPHQVASLIVEVCKRAWESGSGSTPNLENILLASSLALVENGLPLSALPKLLTDADYRGQLLQRVTDSVVRDFFADRFDGYGKRASMLSESTLRRVFLLTFSPTLRYSLGQQSNTLNFRQIMDKGISLIVNLGNLDPQTQRFLGCLLTVGFETAALSRADSSIYGGQRSPYHLIIDEFSQFCAQSEEGLERVLALCRKFGLTLTLAHQTFSQVSKDLQGALQNCIHILFRLGFDDSSWAAPRFMAQTPATPAQDVRRWPWERDQAQAVSFPVSFMEGETQATWKQTFASLERQEAIVRIGQATHLMRGLDVPPPAIDPERLAQLEMAYTRLLFKPLGHPPALSLSQPTPNAQPETANKTNTRRRVKPPLASNGRGDSAPPPAPE